MEKEDAGVTYPSTQQGFADPASEALFLVQDIAGPPRGAESKKAMMTRAARTLGMGYRRVKSAWYGEPAAWRAEEMDRMRATAKAALAARLAREEAALEALRARVEALRGGRA